MCKQASESEMRKMGKDLIRERQIWNTMMPPASLEYNLVYIEWEKHEHPQGYFKIAAKYYF